MTRAIRRRSAPDDEEGSDSLCDLDENVHLLEHYGDSAGFLADIVPDQLYDRTQKSLTYVKKAKKVSRNLDPSDSEDEVDRDLLGRDPSADREDPPKKLPVLCSDGLMRLLPRESVEGGDSASSRDLSEFSGDLEDADDESGRPEERNAQLPDANSEINSGNCRKVFSSIALSIMADPQSNLGSLGVIFNAIMREDDLDVKEVGIVVLMKVFKDIIPGYRIKDPQEDDDSRALSREVRILRQYEIALLHYYKKYLQTLDRMHKNGNYWSILKTVMRCYGELLTNLSYFNYRTNLIASLTSRLNCTEPAGIDYVCYKALYTLFRENQRSDAISEAVRLIARSIKNARRVNPLCIKVLSGLQLDNYGGQSKEEDKPTKPAKGDKIHLSAKMRKQMKMRATIERDLKAHNEEIEAKRTEREMSEIIKCIFVIYFRVLKVNREPELLLVAFEGLSRFAHLINVDIHSDLINVVNEIFNQELPKLMDIGQGATEHIHTALVICVSLLEMLWKTNYSLELDFKRIHSIMYSLISHQSFRQHFPPPRLSRKHVVKSHGELVLDGIALTVLGRRDVPVSRVSSYIKRLAEAALHSSAEFAIASLNLIHTVVEKYNRLENLLDGDTIICTGGYDPYSSDPDSCGAQSSQLWELSLFKRHYHPVVRAYSEYIAKIAPSKLKSDLCKVTVAGSSSLPKVLKSLTTLYNSYNSLPPGDSKSGFSHFSLNPPMVAAQHETNLKNKSAAKYRSRKRRLSNGAKL